MRCSALSPARSSSSPSGNRDRSTPRLDREVKARRYAANGVERFWLVDPVARTLECYRLAGERYEITATASGNATLDIGDLPGLTLPLERLWLT